MIVNSKLVKSHDQNGDWGAAWLASNEAGSGAYKLMPETYVPLEKVDMERNEAHFLGWGHNPKPIRRIEIRPTKETSTRVLALLNGSLDMTDTICRSIRSRASRNRASRGSPAIRRCGFFCSV